MKYRFFQVPVLDSSDAEAELNSFCARHRIAAAAGTTTAGTRVPRIATTTPPMSANTMLVSILPELNPALDGVVLTRRVSGPWRCLAAAAKSQWPPACW